MAGCTDRTFRPNQHGHGRVLPQDGREDLRRSQGEILVLRRLRRGSIARKLGHGQLVLLRRNARSNQTETNEVEFFFFLQLSSSENINFHDHF